MANDLVSAGKHLDKDPTTGQFLTGNKRGRGRPLSSKPRIASAFIEKLGRHFNRHGNVAIQRVFESDPSTYLKLVCHLVPKEFIANVEVHHDITLRREVELFVQPYKKCQEMIGANVEDAKIVDDSNGETSTG
jgi:hypothetical protein